MTVRWDVALVPVEPRTRISPHAVRPLFRAMHAQSFIRDTREHTADDWTEVFARPGAGGHLVFYDGPSLGHDPAFVELAVRFGDAPTELGYGVDEPRYVFLEVRGGPFNFLSPAMLELVDQTLRVRMETISRPHDGLRPRKDNPDEEQPAKPKADGLVGSGRAPLESSLEEID